MTKFRVFLSTCETLLIGLLIGTVTTGCSGVNKDYCYIAGTCSDSEQDLGIEGERDLRAVEPGDMRISSADGGAGDMRGRPMIDPDVLGPNRTAQFDLTLNVMGGTTRFTVIGPSDDGMKLTMRGGPFPVVLFSPGLAIDNKSYVSYGTRLGSYGIVTVLQKVPAEYDHGRYRDNSVELLNWLLKPTGPNADRVKGFLDEKRVGIAGHSLGGKIGLLVAADDSRIKAYFGIDPVDSSNTPAGAEVSKIKFPGGAPLAFVGETVSKMGRPPCAPAEYNYEVLYGKASSPAFSITMPKVAHADWVDGCTVLCTNVCTGGGDAMARERTRALTAKYLTAYFLWTLGGDADVHQYLDGAPFQKDVAAGYVTRVSK